MNLRCQPGDIALVIRAEHLHNIGLIVRVMHPYEGGEIALSGKGFLWEVDCRQLQMWMMNGKLLWRHRGPVPDEYLLPLRGRPVDRSTLQQVLKQTRPMLPEPRPR